MILFQNFLYERLNVCKEVDFLGGEWRVHGACAKTVMVIEKGSLTIFLGGYAAPVGCGVTANR
jgi:hypothetical protein